MNRNYADVIYKIVSRELEKRRHLYTEARVKKAGKESEIAERQRIEKENGDVGLMVRTLTANAEREAEAQARENMAELSMTLDWFIEQHIRAD